MTIFWDVLHFYTLQKHIQNNPELQNDINLIERQIKKLLDNNHDVQLHIHPHWLDAKYLGNRKWAFTYDKYKLHNLNDNDDPGDINTISGCINTSVQILKKYNKNIDSKIAFRAGGYYLEPFESLSPYFLNHNILIDSSKIGITNTGKPFYKFINTPDKIDTEGPFYEFPLSTISLPAIKNIWFKFLNRKYKYLKKYGDGTSMGEALKKNQTLISKLLTLLKRQHVILTPEGSFKEKFKYLFAKSANFSLMTLHPKYLNEHQISMIEDLLDQKKLQFISIADYIKQNGIK